MSRALLVLVTGHPASGKSTVAAALATRLGLPVLAKDDFQETLFDAGIEAPRSGPLANRLALRAARALLEAGIACVVDSNLEPGRWRDPVAELLAATGARLLQVRCRADGGVQWTRFEARAARRHPGHRDAERLASLRDRLLGPPLAPLDLPGTLVDHDSTASDAAALDAVIAAVAAALAAR